MALHPLAGKPAPRESAAKPSASGDGVFYAHNRTRTTRRTRWPSAPRATAAPPSKTPSTRSTSWPSARPSASTGASQGIDGPLFIGMDTHALSEPAQVTAIEVFAANDVDVVIQAGLGYTPTPVISHAILTYNRGRHAHLADGVVITPRTTRPTTAASSTTRPPAARPTPASPR